MGILTSSFSLIIDNLSDIDTTALVSEMPLRALACFASVFSQALQDYLNSILLVSLLLVHSSHCPQSDFLFRMPTVCTLQTCHALVPQTLCQCTSMPLTASSEPIVLSYLYAFACCLHCPEALCPFLHLTHSYLSHSSSNAKGMYTHANAHTHTHSHTHTHILFQILFHYRLL